ncbi:hypothetical protein [Brevundimonas sp.]|uniref:hypothetical protein n=1 Tax=Brevundimonas sp. TaxID=1871086 RepID=UPI0026165551|nr:hypothetical protein [Brevundimonas sp.]
MAWRHGFIGGSFGRYIWSRTDRGWTATAIIEAPEFWALARKFANDDELEDIGGDRGDGRPALGLMIANERTQKLRDKVYKQVSRYLSEQLALGHPAIQALIEREHRFEVDGGSWLTALDVFSIYRQDFSFSRLCYPARGVVITVGNFERNASTAFDASGSIALPESDIVMIEGRGGDWLIRTSSDLVVELSQSRGIQWGRSTEP